MEISAQNQYEPQLSFGYKGYIDLQGNIKEQEEIVIKNAIHSVKKNYDIVIDRQNCRTEKDPMDVKYEYHDDVHYVVGGFAYDYEGNCLGEIRELRMRELIALKVFMTTEPVQKLYFKTEGII